MLLVFFELYSEMRCLPGISWSICARHTWLFWVSLINNSNYKKAIMWLIEKSLQSDRNASSSFSKLYPVMLCLLAISWPVCASDKRLLCDCSISNLNFVKAFMQLIEWVTSSWLWMILAFFIILGNAVSVCDQLTSSYTWYTVIRSLLYHLLEFRERNYAINQMGHSQLTLNDTSFLLCFVIVCLRSAGSS